MTATDGVIYKLGMCVSADKRYSEAAVLMLNGTEPAVVVGEICRTLAVMGGEGEGAVVMLLVCVGTQWLTVNSCKVIIFKRACFMSCNCLVKICWLVYSVSFALVNIKFLNLFSENVILV